MFSYSRDKYSRYVSLMKILLPVGIILVLTFSLGGPYILSRTPPVVQGEEEKPEHDRMIHPHYMSTDTDGQPYEVVATAAEQTGGKGEPTHLTKPEGSITNEEGTTFKVTADTGVYDPDDKELTLKGHVNLKSTDGYDVQTVKARVELDNQTIEGNAPVEGSGPRGELKAKDGFKIKRTDQGDVITLKGPSRVVINQGP